MASYFSNHSGSRFPGSGATPPPANNPVVTARPPPVARAPSSKHFSTSVNSEDKTPQGKEKGIVGTGGIGAGAVHPLRTTWVFFFRQQRAPGNKITNYEEGIKKISAFGSVESFWSLWTHLQPPSGLLPTTDYLLFHAGVRRPVWEDPLNITGGKWIIRLKKGVSDRIWEDLILAVVGDQFDECGTPAPAPEGAPEGEWPEICGCTISVRQSEDIISLWNRFDDPKVREKIRDTLRKVLNLPSTTVMEYKTNNDSMQDKSSFRTTNVDRTPLI